MIRAALLLTGLLLTGCEVKPVGDSKAHTPFPITSELQQSPAEANPAEEADVPDHLKLKNLGRPEEDSVPVDPLDGSVTPNDPNQPMVHERWRILTWNFGMITPSTETKHRFSITNDGAIPWTIKTVSQTCTCALGEFTLKKIKPNQVTFLEVALRGTLKEGHVRQAITVEFAEPDAPLYQLRIRGDISQSLSALPESLNFGRLASGSKGNRSFEFRNNSDRDVSITRIEKPKWLTVASEPTPKTEKRNSARQTWTMKVEVDPDRFKPGLHGVKIIVHTDSEKWPPVTVPVTFRVNAPIEVIPGHLTFYPVDKGHATQKTVFVEVSSELKDLQEKDFVLTHTLGKELDVQITRKVSSNRFLLVGTYRPNRDPGVVKGALEIKPKGISVNPARVEISGEVR